MVMTFMEWGWCGRASILQRAAAPGDGPYRPRALSLKQSLPPLTPCQLLLQLLAAADSLSARLDTAVSYERPSAPKQSVPRMALASFAAPCCR